MVNFCFQSLHLLPLIYPTFTCVDPYSEYESGYIKLLITDPLNCMYGTIDNSCSILRSVRWIVYPLGNSIFCRYELYLVFQMR